jgi:hypothetical protein
VLVGVAVVATAVVIVVVVVAVVLGRVPLKVPRTVNVDDGRFLHVPVARTTAKSPELLASVLSTRVTKRPHDNSLMPSRCWYRNHHSAMAPSTVSQSEFVKNGTEKGAE